MRIFRRRRRVQPDPAEARFNHASGADTLAEVLAAQVPDYESEQPRRRPRGRSARMFPDG